MLRRGEAVRAGAAARLHRPRREDRILCDTSLKLIECLRDPFPQYRDQPHTLSLQYDSRWTNQDMDEILQAAEGNATIRVLNVNFEVLIIFRDNIGLFQVERLASIVSCLGGLRVLCLDGPPSRPDPAVVDALLLGAIRCPSKSLREVRLYCDGGTEAIVDFLRHFPAIDTVVSRRLASPGFAEILGRCFRYMRKLKTLCLYEVESSEAIESLAPLLNGLTLEVLEVATRNGMDFAAQSSVFTSLQQVYTSLLALRRFVVSGPTLEGTKIEDHDLQLLRTSRDAPLLEDLEIRNLIFSRPDTAFESSIVNTALKSLRLRSCTFRQTSFALLSRCFQGVTNLELHSCDGDGLGRSDRWTSALQLLALTALHLDLAPLSNREIDAIGSSVSVRPIVSSTVLEMNNPKAELPALRRLVASCRGSLCIRGDYWEENNLAHVIDGLATNRGLESLVVVLRNNFYARGTVTRLFHASRSIAGLREFELCLSSSVDEVAHPRWHPGTDGYEAIRQLVGSSTLCKFVLEGDGLCGTPTFVGCVADGVSVSRSLKSLGLNVVVSDLTPLANALRATHCQLEGLSICARDLSEQAITSFLRTVEALTSLHELRVIDYEVRSDSVFHALVDVARHVSLLQRLDVTLAPTLNTETNVLQFYLKVNRFIASALRIVSDGCAPLGLRPFLLASLATVPENGSGSEQRKILQAQAIYRRLIRPIPSLVQSETICDVDKEKHGPLQLSTGYTLRFP